jgi:hypothetical protein
MERLWFQPYHDFMNAGGLRWTAEAVKQWIGSSKTPAAFEQEPIDESGLTFVASRSGLMTAFSKITG